MKIYLAYFYVYVYIYIYIYIEHTYRKKSTGNQLTLNNL